MTTRLFLTGLLAYASIGLAQVPDPCATTPASCATLIETHATSEMRIPNSAVDVAVGVSASGKDLPDVQRSLAGKSNTLLTYLKAQQVERLITTRLSFAPETKYDKSGPDKTVGYSGTAQVSFRAAPQRVADLLAGVLSNGANRIESTTFTPTEQEIADERRHLSEDATRTAIAQAGAIAKAAGMIVVAIRNISVDNDNSFRPVGISEGMMVNDFERARSAQTTPVDTASGDEQLAIRVNIVAAAAR